MIITELNNGKYTALASELSLGLRQGKKEGIRIFVKTAQYETFDKTCVHTIITDLVIRGGNKTIFKIDNIHWNYDEIEGQDSIIDIVENLITYIKFTTGNWKKRIDMSVLGVNTEELLVNLLKNHTVNTFRIVIKRLKKEVSNFLTNQIKIKEEKLNINLAQQINNICKKDGRSFTTASWYNDARIVDEYAKNRILELMNKKNRGLYDDIEELRELSKKLHNTQLIYLRRENQSYYEFLKEIFESLKK